jgi:hypothetical protein
MGKRDDTVSEVYARQITERIVALDNTGSGGGGSDCPPVLLGIALKEGELVDGKSGPESFHLIVDAVLKLYREGVDKAVSS